MMLRSKTLAAAALVFGALLVAAPANAQLGLKDCSDKYDKYLKTAPKDKKTFPDFQKSDCGPGAKPVTPAPKPAAKVAPAAPAAAAPAATTAAPAAAPTATPGLTKAEKRKAAKAAKAATVPAGPVTGPVFPAAIADTYKAKKPAKARLATCLDQYKANKATNANGGLRWIQKGGGYYSQCNKKLKG